MEDKVKQAAATTIGGLVYFMLTAIGVAFLAGVPLGVAAHKFTHSVFTPDAVVVPNK
jgi:hypothetical protein